MSSATINILIEKLTNNAEEIRLIALREVDSKIRRCLSTNEGLKFNGPFLLKSLIRWFGNIPLKDEGTVLSLMLFVLGSESGDEIIDYLKPERLQKELNKIEFFLKRTEHLQLLNDIREIVRSKSHRRDFSSKRALEESDNLKLDLSALTVTRELDIEGSKVDFVKCWDTPGLVDLSSLKLLKQSLCKENGEDNLQHALSYIPNSIRDYPSEYFLQPPYVYKNILQLLATEPTATQIVQMFNKALLGRIKFHQLAATFQYKEDQTEISFNQISVTRYVKECFSHVMGMLKSSLNEYHSGVNKCLAIFAHLIDLALLDPHGRRESYDSVLNDLSDLCNHFRHALGVSDTRNFIARKVYIQILDLIIKLVKRRNLSFNSDYDPNQFKSPSSAVNFYCENGSEYDGVTTAWLKELQIALFDVSIKIVYPNLYDSILTAIDLTKMKSASILKSLLLCGEFLSPAVELLRDPNQFTDEETLSIGFNALDSLSIHESFKLVRLLVKTISLLGPKFSGNIKLRQLGDDLMLKLVSYPEVEIKKVVYQETANAMKKFFSAVVDGEKIFGRTKKDVDKSELFCNLGVPITREILTEIICLGYCNSDTQVSSCSDTILTLIVKGRNIIGSYWKNVQSVLIPVLPLLQSITNSYSSLGKSVMELFDPDTKELPESEVIKGSIRFLFNEDDFVRDETLVRLLYIVDSYPLASEYSPNIKLVAESLNNHICQLEHPVDLPKRFIEEGGYDESVVYTLIDLLREPKVEPSIRKSSMMQLNSMAADPRLCHLIHDLDAWFLVITAIDNSMKKENVIDYPEAVIPAINLFAKFCILIPEFRAELSREINIYLLLLRAMFKYHKMATLQPDCAIALFLLSYSDFITESKNVSVPLVLSKLTLPFVGKTYHWIESPFYKMSNFEKALLSIRGDNPIQTNRTDPRSLFEFKLNLEANSNPGTSRLEALLEKEVMWQYLRITFASLWFGGLENTLKMCKLGSISYEIKDKESLDFNANLKMIKNDVTLIGSTSPSKAFKHCVTKVQNAIQHSDIVESLQFMDCIFKLNLESVFHLKSLIKALERFCIAIPNTDSDELLFGHITTFLTNTLDKNNKEILNWTVKEFQQSHCNFLSLIPRNPSNPELYEKNCVFIVKFVEKLIDHGMMKTAKEVALKLTNPILDAMKEKFNKSKLNHLRGLVNALRIMAVIPNLFEDYGEDFVNKVINRLLLYALATKAKTQTGSHFIKVCLLAIGHLSKQISELVLKSKYLHFVIGLAGHVDLEIRTCAWNIMEKLSADETSAEFLVTELQHLPGGFHACCMSTALDDQEVDLVREVAAMVFGNLISHKGSDNDLKICPKCDDRPIKDGDLPQDLVFGIVNRHNFLGGFEGFIRTFSPTETIEIEHSDKLVYCGTIRGFTRVLSCLIDLDESYSEEVFFVSSVGFELINLISRVPVDVTPNSLEMSAEICRFVMTALYKDPQLRDRVILTNRAIVGSLVYLLNIEIYDNQDCKINLWDYGAYFVALLTTISSTPQGFQLICQVLEQNDNGRELQGYLIVALRREHDEKIVVNALEFLKKILVMHQKESWTFVTLVDMMETEKICFPLSSRSLDRVSLENGENRDPNSGNFDSGNRTKKPDEANEEVTIAQAIFKQIYRLYQLICSSDNLQQKPTNQNSARKRLTFELLGAYLKSSHEARAAASGASLFNSLLGRLEDIHTLFGASCKDFIRKHGDSKKNPIIEEMKLVLDILTGWFSVDCLMDPDCVYDLCKNLIKLWPWISADHKLMGKTMKLLVYLSEDSVPVCKGFSSQYSSISHSIMQLVVVAIGQEMNRIKHPQFDVDMLKTSLRIITNCCSCIEGRILIGKLNVMDIISRLHPSVTKFAEPWPLITMIWMTFWEIFSRYPEGAKVCHMNLLFSLVHREKYPQIRLKALTILRNMAFVCGNRVSLLAMEEYLETIKLGLNLTSKEELNLSVTTIWKLIANNFKAKNKIKNTSIPQKLLAIQKELSLNTYPEDNLEETLMMLDVINNILYA